MKKEKVVFLLPCLNEVESVRKVIDRINYIKFSDRFEHKIYFVDGGSVDGTVEELKKFDVEVLTYKKGYGRQYRYAFKKIDCDYFITGDCDCTYPFGLAYKYFLDFIIEKEYDFISTNRFHKLHKGSMPNIRFVGNKILTLFTNLIFNLSLKDSQSGMWIFRKNVLKKFILINNDMAFSEELKIEAFRKLSKNKVCELPINYFKRSGDSKLNFSHSYKNFIFLFFKK